jgi:hypothetical protein
MSAFRFCTTAILVATIQLRVFAQDDLKKIVPASPTTAALGEYGSVPVGLSSGIPTIDIPLHTVLGKNLNLPISLSYHGGGVKVEEMASWVGLGWSLNAGGVITRQLRSLPDEAGDGVFDALIPIWQVMQNATQLMLAAKGLIDAEPDMFYYNFNGRAGSFMYDQSTGKFVTIPESDIIIEYDRIKSEWVINDNGTSYVFADKEDNMTWNTCSPS